MATTVKAFDVFIVVMVSQKFISGRTEDLLDEGRTLIDYGHSLII